MLVHLLSQQTMGVGGRKVGRADLFWAPFGDDEAIDRCSVRDPGAWRIPLPALITTLHAGPDSGTLSVRAALFVVRVTVRLLQRYHKRPSLGGSGDGKPCQN